MLKLECLFFASLKDAAGCSKTRLELVEGSTVGQLIEALEAQFPKLVPFQRRYQVAVQAEMQPHSHVLCDGDEVALIPAVSGGAPDDLILVAEAPIDLNRVYNSVLRDDCGAVTIFAGTVRNYVGSDPAGSRVDSIDYSVYQSMAEKSMAELASQVREKLPVARTCLWHRTGVVPAGEASVAIAVSTPHRAESFEACRWLIDELKRQVPIWKKEIGPDGSVWIEGDARVPSV